MHWINSFGNKIPLFCLELEIHIDTPSLPWINASENTKLKIPQPYSDLRLGQVSLVYLKAKVNLRMPL